MGLVQQVYKMKVDVCVHVFGKPYQTLITLKSLIDTCGENIDKIYYIEEAKQPQDYDFQIIKNNLGYSNLERYVTKHYLSISPSDKFRSTVDPDYRLSLRYQYGLEQTDKKYLLVIHNDVLFTKNIISEFLTNIGDGFCIGHIGQCWNCPLKYENICDSHLLESNLKKNFSYNQIIQFVDKHPSSRTSMNGKKQINENRPFPLPECRVNEWCTLIDAKKYKKECVPTGDVHPIGGYFGMDIGDVWFKEMVHKGYNFKHQNIYDFCTHGYFSEVGHGHSAMSNHEMYKRDEERAKEYFNKNYK